MGLNSHQSSYKGEGSVNDRLRTPATVAARVKCAAARCQPPSTPTIFVGAVAPAWLSNPTLARHRRYRMTVRAANIASPRTSREPLLRFDIASPELI